jgi:hypothetical protein
VVGEIHYRLCTRAILRNSLTPHFSRQASLVRTKGVSSLFPTQSPGPRCPDRMPLTQLARLDFTHAINNIESKNVAEALCGHAPALSPNGTAETLPTLVGQ